MNFFKVLFACFFFVSLLSSTAFANSSREIISNLPILKDSVYCAHNFKERIFVDDIRYDDEELDTLVHIPQLRSCREYKGDE